MLIGGTVMPQLSISTWSLHHSLGKAWYDQRPEGFANRSDHHPRIQLLDVPAEVAAQGIDNLEICHFHFPSTDDAFIAQLRNELDRYRVSLYSILIDAWDITHPDPAQREDEIAHIRRWIEVASVCGAANARVVAGESETTPEAVSLSVQNLTALAEYGRNCGVRVMTENFKQLTRRADPLIEIIERCDGKVGLCTDFGNFKGEHKMADLARVLPYADSIHTKANYKDGVMVKDEFLDCMELTRKVNFEGYYTLIFQNPGEEWTYLNGLKQEVIPYL